MGCCCSEVWCLQRVELLQCSQHSGSPTGLHHPALRELLLRADQALYTAKHGGRDRVVCLEAEAETHLLGRIEPKPSTAA